MIWPAVALLLSFAAVTMVAFFVGYDAGHRDGRRETRRLLEVTGPREAHLRIVPTPEKASEP